MRLEDWREWPAERLAPVFEHEVARWRQQLSWDARDLFALIEQGRCNGHLAGLVAADATGRPAGWCYASVQDGLLFIGALHGERADIVRHLLDAVLAAPEAAYVRGYRCFVLPDTSAVAAALLRRRFEVQRFRYLRRPIGLEILARAPDSVLGPWRVDQLPDAARLVARGYAGSDEGRCFAPSGRLEEWASYLAQLVRTPACGTFAPDESLAVGAGPDGPRLAALLIATRLSCDTTHVAQVVVDPARRGAGLGAALVNGSAWHAAATGARQQTLLVADSNTRARGLYARLGFEEISHFLYADRPRISRTATAATGRCITAATA
jgi:ribosomal protein S18 acetylase RimI-like enzyme